MNEIFIGKKIAEGRKSKDLSQAQFAGMLNVSQQAVAKWERGDSLPDLIMLGRIANTIGEDLNYFSGTDKNQSESKNKTEKSVGWNMAMANWKDTDFSGTKSSIEKIGASNIEGCKFIGLNLSGIVFKANNLIKNDFSNAKLIDSKFSMANVVENDFTHAALNNTTFVSSNLKKNNFANANLINVFFKYCNFELNLTDSLNKVNFHGTGIKQIVFTGEILDCSFVSCIFKDVEFKDVVLKNVFFKNNKMKKVIFSNCKVDKLTYEILENTKCDLANLTVI